jgi:hypothetical protein
LSVKFPDQDFELPEDFKTAIAVVHPAYEQRHDNPAQNYGIGSVNLAFRLIGPQGAIEFQVMTGWYLPHVAERLRRETRHEHSRCSLEGHPGPTYFHTPEPQYASQDAYDDCALLGGRCYCDVGYTIGDELWAALVRAGEPGLWKVMKELHDNLGGNE